MKYFAATVLALASVATAQLENIPSCALACFLGPLGSDGCKDLTDFACHCQKAESLFAAVIPCAQKACSASDQAATIAAVEETCAGAGVPIEVPDSASPSSSAAPSSTPEPTPTPTTPTPEPTPTPTDAPTSEEPSATPTPDVSSSEVVSSASASVTPSSNGTLPVTPSPTLSEFTGGAAQATKAAGLLGAAALALLAL